MVSPTMATWTWRPRFGFASLVTGAGEGHATGRGDFAGYGLAHCWAAGPLTTFTFRFTGERLGLLVGPVRLRVCRYEHSAMADRYQAISDSDIDRFTRQPYPDGIQHRCEPDLAGLADLSGRWRLWRCLNGRGVILASQPESFPWNDITSPFVTAVKVVFTNPSIDAGLGILDAVKHLPVQELTTQSLVRVCSFARFKYSGLPMHRALISST